jgi:hypothetical protein
VLINAIAPHLQGVAAVGLTMLGVLIVGGNAIARRLSGKALMFASVSVVGLMMICMTVFVVTGLANMTVDVDELATYTHETGLFSIEVPANWERNDHSDAGGIRVDWIDFRGSRSINGLLTVEVFRTSAAATTANLTSYLQDHLTERHGTAQGFAIGEPVIHADGRVEIPFEYARLRARSIIEQRGDTLSILTLSIRDTQYDDLAETGDTMLESYALDLSVPLR